MSNQNRDINFLESIQTSDKQVFEMFVKNYYQSFFQFAYQYVKSKEDAEEIAQDLFIDIWTKRDTLNITNLEAYCWVTIRNKSLNWLAKRKVNFVEISEKNTRPYLEENSNELQETIQKGIAQLPPQAKLVFLLCREKDMSYQEVANHLSIGKETVKSHMKTALSKLRAFLEAHGFSIICPSIFFNISFI